jgi:hypothetical protein
LYIAAFGMDIKTVNILLFPKQELNSGYGDKKVPELAMELSIPYKEGSLIITVMSLEFNKCYGQNYYEMCRDARYMPAGIVNAMYV